MLKVTLTRSIIGNTPSNRRTVAALGLRKIGQSNTFNDTPDVRGMIHKVKHLLTVETIEGGEKVRRRQGKAAANPAPKAAPKAAKPAPKAEAKPAEPAKTETKAVKKPAAKKPAAKTTKKKED